MKPVLSDDDKSQLEKRIAEAEKLTKIQIVLATVKRSDSYPEIPWKAFALGVSIRLLVFSLDMILFSWIQDIAVLVSVVAILAVAAFVVQMTILFPRFARLFLSGSRAKWETRQYADFLFFPGNFLYRKTYWHPSADKPVRTEGHNPARQRSPQLCQR